MASRSPTAVTPGPKSSAPETPAINDTPTTPQAVPFPPPQTFDFIPPLHGVLLRLLSPQTNGDGAANGANDGVAGQDQSQSQQQPSSSAVGNDGNNAGLLGPGHTSAADLDVKNLPTEVSSIKIRIQKAQAVVESLPDIDRTVDEQEEEIHDLEDRITRLKSVIADFGRRANDTNSGKTRPSP
ncbi:RNA polymerase II mediator complex middle subunit MED9 [Aspergillus stella-maris]|uniref:RNA polymerase II mediator complex middle subunit MED9 n=1 Tax=Aspergillus stella-maris TaxID=1810926 RepID=UPI003CCCEA86